MLALCGGMTAFFLLAFFLSGMLGEGERVQRFMLMLAGVFGLLSVMLVLGGAA